MRCLQCSYKYNACKMHAQTPLQAATMSHIIGCHLSRHGLSCHLPRVSTRSCAKEGCERPDNMHAFGKDSTVYLGIDIGTSKCAAVVVSNDGALQASSSLPHNGGTPSPDGHAEQDPELLLQAAADAVRQLPADLRHEVQKVGVTGQMHGVVVVDDALRPLTPLVTWQDQRCLRTESFLPELQERTGYRLQTGYGCATLAWLINAHELPAGAVSSGTVHDLLVARLCGLSQMITDETDAASFGLFSLADLYWDRKAITAAGIRPQLLPSVVPSGGTAGKLTDPMAADLGLRAGIPVCVALGDNQASLMATLEHPEEELALTLGTGGQLSAVVPAMTAGGDDDARFEYRPYPGLRYLAVAASLCGGAAWAWLVDTAGAWCTALGVQPPPRDDIFSRLDALGLEADTTLRIRPHFLGERNAPDLRGSIEGIDLTNMDLGAVARALATGIIRSFVDRLPANALAKRRTIVCSGNALRKSALLRRAVEETFGLPVRLGAECEEAAVGAALLARRGLQVPGID
ncbi:MAG: hypothetical protein GF331_17805 [Chitinivibrionales bacterium]|nr:hypothetical protein [Chitinivibrionales bacterium]